MRSLQRVLAPAIALAALLAISSCAYYNTFYLAQKYYNRGTLGTPYPMEKPQGQQTNDFRKSIEYSKKLLSQYPDSKWVDDAYLLWARGLLGQNDPLKTVEMLESFHTRFPESELHADATFYLGVGYRQARRYHPAVLEFNDFLEMAPEHDMVPYAYLERSRSLSALERYSEAADDATRLIEGYGGSGLRVDAYIQRAEALLQNREYAAARGDFRFLGSNSRTDEERLDYLLREADCFEAARDYDAELELLQDALSHEVPPVRPDSLVNPAAIRRAPGWDRYGRILMRIGTVHSLAGRVDESLESYVRIAEDYPKTPLAGEAQYRIGYLYETVGDDFERARLEYDKVKEHSGATGFGLQAHQRLQNLQRLEQYRAEGDSTGNASEAGFLLAEQYLFQLDKPERALEEYERLAAEYEGTAAGGKANNARAWVLREYLDSPDEADSLLWHVIYEYPATEAQLAARDYLERVGYVVDVDLIVMPDPPPPPPFDSTRVLPASATPPTVNELRGPNGEPVLMPPSARVPGLAATGLAIGALPDSLTQRLTIPDSVATPPDTTAVGPMPAPPDTTAVPPAATPPDSVTTAPEQSTPVDSTSTAPPDTSRAGQ